MPRLTKNVITRTRDIHHVIIIYITKIKDKSCMHCFSWCSKWASVCPSGSSIDCSPLKVRRRWPRCGRAFSSRFVHVNLRLLSTSRHSRSHAADPAVALVVITFKFLDNYFPSNFFFFTNANTTSSALEIVQKYFKLLTLLYERKFMLPDQTVSR